MRKTARRPASRVHTAATVAAAAQAGSPSAAAAAQPASPAPLAEKTVAPDIKADKPKGQSGRSEHTKALDARPAGAPQMRPADKASGTPDKPSDTPDKPSETPDAAVVHADKPAPEHPFARAALSEARDITQAPASTSPAPASTGPVNPATPLLTTPTLSPITAVRIDARADVAVPVAGLAVEIVTRARPGPQALRHPPRPARSRPHRRAARRRPRRQGHLAAHRRAHRNARSPAPRRTAARARAAAGRPEDRRRHLHFSLRDQSQGFRDQAQRDNANTPTTRLIIPDDEQITSEAARGYGRLVGLGGGVDIRV